MRVILGKAPYAHQPVHRPGWLIPVHHAKLGQAQWQVAIAFQAMLEDLYVTRTIHRLERKPTVDLRLDASGFCRKHVLAVPGPMTGGVPTRLVANVRRVAFPVVGGELVTHVGDPLLENGPALR